MDPSSAVVAEYTEVSSSVGDGIADKSGDVTGVTSVLVVEWL